jgi:hypothetical protein
VGEGRGDVGDRPAPVPLVLVQVGGEGGEEHVDQGVEAVPIGGPVAAGLDHQGPDVGVPEPVGPGGEAPGAGLGAEGQVQVAFEQFTMAA